MTPQKYYILKKRIAYLESLLSAHNISFDAPDAPSSQSIIAPISVVISPTHARFFYSLFHGRSDVYAKRAVMKTEKPGIFLFVKSVAIRCLPKSRPSKGQVCVLPQSQLGAAESARIDGASDRRKIRWQRRDRHLSSAAG